MKQSILSPMAMVEQLMKGSALPEGTVKNWKGKDYIKKAGKWVPKPKGKGTDEKAPEKKPEGKGRLKLSFTPPADLRKMTPKQNREYVEYVKKTYKPDQIQGRISLIEKRMDKLRGPIDSGEGSPENVRFFINLQHNRDLHEHALNEAQKDEKGKGK